MKSYSTLTRRYLVEHKKRTALTLLGIILAISLFSAVSTLYYSWIDTVVEAVKSRGNYEVMYEAVSGDKIKSIAKNAEVQNSGVTEDYGSGRIIEAKGREYTLKITNYNAEAYTNIFNIAVKEGRLPDKKNEIMIEVRLRKYLSAMNLGDEISVELNNYGHSTSLDDNIEKFRIVGFYEPRFSNTGSTFSALGHIDKEISKGEQYNVFVNLKGKRDKVSSGKKIALDNGLEVKGDRNQVNFNEALLRMYGQSQDPAERKSLRTFVVMVTAVIVVCTIAVIYNAFSISVVERTRHFGVLRAIGATPEQIRKLVFKEAAIMGAIAIPLGIVCGYSGAQAMLRFIGNLSFADFIPFKLGVYPQVAIICIIIGSLTIFLSVWGPAKMAALVSPMEAIRNTKNIKRERFKIRRSGLIRKIFGIEGELSYKNLRRNPKEFWITIFSLVVSLVLYIVLTNVVSIARQVDSFDIKEAYYDSRLNTSWREEGRKIENELLEGIKKLDGVEEVFLQRVTNYFSAIEKDKINDRYLAHERKQGRLRDVGDSGFVYVSDLVTAGYDRNSLNKMKKHLVEGSIDEAALNNGGVLIIQRNKGRSSSGRAVYENLTTYKVGDKINIPRINYERKPGEVSQDIIVNQILKNDLDSFTVVGILDIEPNRKFENSNFITLIFSEEMYRKITGSVEFDRAFIKFRSDKDREELNGYFEDLSANNKGLYYMDFHKGRKEAEQAGIFYYAIIAVIALVGLVNIINTININILVKKREFALYKITGMTGIQFNKLVILEGTLYGIIAAVIGTTVGALLTALIMSSSSVAEETLVRLPVRLLSYGVAGVIAVTLLASLAPLRKLNRMNITESLRMEE
jgi:putative ABC transport system permease protein